MFVKRSRINSKNCLAYFEQNLKNRKQIVVYGEQHLHGLNVDLEGCLLRYKLEI